MRRSSTACLFLHASSRHLPLSAVCLDHSVSSASSAAFSLPLCVASAALTLACGKPMPTSFYHPRWPRRASKSSCADKKSTRPRSRLLRDRHHRLVQCAASCERAKAVQLYLGGYGRFEKVRAQYSTCEFTRVATVRSNLTIRFITESLSRALLVTYRYTRRVDRRSLGLWLSPSLALSKVGAHFRAHIQRTKVEQNDTIVDESCHVRFEFPALTYTHSTRGWCGTGGGPFS